jgi:ribosomal-protein-alanine N-acetyltransferase
MATDEIFYLETERLQLAPWSEDDRERLIALYADPLASRDFGRILRRDESEKTFEKYLTAFEDYGFTRWKLTLKDGTFIGTTGVMRVINHQALGAHDEIGWRLLPAFWGTGYATEAARAAQKDAHSRCGLRDIITYTAPDNTASEAVMKRLGYARAPNRDFSAHYSTVVGVWHGQVWTVPNPD